LLYLYRSTDTDAFGGPQRRVKLTETGDGGVFICFTGTGTEVQILTHLADVSAERNRRKQKMERLSRNIHLRSIDEAAEELQQSCNRGATELQQSGGGLYFVRAPSHGSMELMDLVRSGC
jgi:hypothetical protein